MAEAKRGPAMAFSWGYSGWGNHTIELLELVDAVEASRGFEPPVFADVRLRRQVRAAGFRDRAFEHQLGARYRWLPGLGNRAIADPSLDQQLDDPSAIDDLIELVDASARRRVIFFCSCPSPHERHLCHRGLVAKLLVRKREDLTVQEWPGGPPVIATLTVTPEVLKRLKKPSPPSRIPIAPTVRAFALGCFSLLRCSDGTDEVIVRACGAVFTARGWQLPIDAVYPAWKRSLTSDAIAWRKTLELEPLGAKLRDEPWREIELMSEIDYPTVSFGGTRR